MPKKFLTPLLITVTILTFALSVSFFAFAAAPKTINFQGRLLQASNAPLTGTFNLTFNIYDDSSSSLVWSETDNVALDTAGVFSVVLGKGTTLNLDFSKSYSIEVALGSETFSPRQPLSAVPYAFYTMTGGSSSGTNVLKAGDNMTGTLTVQANAIVNGTGYFYGGVVSGGDILPMADLGANAGSSSYRFANVHAVNFYGVMHGGPDVAEKYVITDNVERGDVVVIDQNRELKLCRKENDPRVAGVVSTSPGVVLEQVKTGTPIGLLGCVPTKVDATKYPVQAGDALTTSSTPGYAMKAIDPKPGTILGKALESLPTGKKKIMVLVSPQ